MDSLASVAYFVIVVALIAASIWIWVSGYTP